MLVINSKHYWVLAGTNITAVLLPVLLLLVLVLLLLVLVPVLVLVRLYQNRHSKTKKLLEYKKESVDSVLHCFFGLLVIFAALLRTSTSTSTGTVLLLLRTGSLVLLLPVLHCCSSSATESRPESRQSTR